MGDDEACDRQRGDQIGEPLLSDLVKIGRRIVRSRVKWSPLTGGYETN
jgi:hypothetical protein